VYQQIKDKFSKNKFKEALNLALSFNKQNRNDHYICFIISEIYNKLNDYTLAEKYLIKAITLKKEKKYYLSLGNLYLHLQKYNKAIVSYKKSLKLDNKFAVVYNNIAFCYKQIGDQKKSLHNVLKAFENDGGNHYYIYNLANAYKEQDRLDEAEIYYDQAIKLKPEDNNCLYNKSFVCLKKRIYSKGWELYEKRIDVGESDTNAKIFNLKIHKLIKNSLFINNNLKKKSLNLSVMSEQGVGDQILFSSMIKELLNIQPNTSFFIDKRLVPIFSRTFKTSAFYDKSDYKIIEDKISNKSKFIYLGSLGKFFRKKISDFKQKRYLTSNQKTVLKIKEKLKLYNNKKFIGISWSSAAKKIAKGNIPLINFINIFNNNDYKFINLQYGNIKEEIDKVNSKIKNKIILFEEIDLFNDLDGLFSLIDSMDIIITIDNINLQIAGALGKKTFVITPHTNQAFLWSKSNLGKIDWYPTVDTFYTESNFSNKIIKSREKAIQQINKKLIRINKSKVI